MLTSCFLLSERYCYGRIHASRGGSRMRVALLGAGTIARLVLEQVRGGEVPGVEIVALAGRSGSARASALAREFGVACAAGRAALVAARPAAVLEAASHDAVREHL